jgi:hypothetical protein
VRGVLPALRGAVVPRDNAREAAAAAGIEVGVVDLVQQLQVDLKHGDDVGDFSAEWLLENVCQGFVVDGVVASPPCTDLTNSGARHWAAKDADGRTAASVHLVYQTLRTIDFLKPNFWALENPIGRIAKLVPELGKPRCVFDPCDFAG